MWQAIGAQGCVKAQSNNSFKPNLLRYIKNMAEKACHVFASATQVGLTQVLDAIGVSVKIKQVAWLALSAALGAAISGYLVWANATREHKRLMRLEINSGYINSLDGVSTGKNLTFSRKDFQDALAECIDNSRSLSSQNSLATGSYTIEGWKEYVAQGVIAYTALKSVGRQSPVYACILDSQGRLEETRQVMPLQSSNDNFAMAIKDPSFLEVEF